MTKIAVVYHSGYGHTQKVAEGVARGAGSVEGTTVTLISVADIETSWDALDEADAIIFGSPTYMASSSAKFKEFMDATSGRWMKQAWKDKLAAGFTNSGSMSGDKLTTLVQFATFAAQHSMLWVGTGMMPGNNHSGGSVEDNNRLGSSLGLMTQSNVDQGPDVAPPSSDIRTAEAFGVRVAHTAARIAKA
jgi:multimeric flavodoxin WrbA